jgi:hypothetical protein
MDYHKDGYITGEEAKSLIDKDNIALERMKKLEAEYLSKGKLNHFIGNNSEIHTTSSLESSPMVNYIKGD